MQYRQLLVNVHVMTAGFFLVTGVMFAVTGGLYTYGVRGGYDTEKLSLSLDLPAEPTLSELEETARRVLAENNAPLPSGGPGMRKVGTSWSFDWSGVNYEFSLEPAAVAGRYNASIKKTDAHRFFVQLHKAKGGWPFKLVAAGLAMALLVLFMGGTLLAFSSPFLKRAFLYSFLAGGAVFAIAALTS
ncbi:MAG TPA: hypothetical protein PKC28_10070 [Bdellovibrionales bacterium]|nr:hypothetical protein [Bdellovibrionales bacterium]